MLLFVTAVCVSLSPADRGREVHPARRCKLQLLAPAHSAAGRPARRDRARLGGRQGDVQWRNSEENDVSQPAGQISVSSSSQFSSGNLLLSALSTNTATMQVSQDRGELSYEMFPIFMLTLLCPASAPGRETLRREESQPGQPSVL